jgi:hypothetical protein
MAPDNALRRNASQNAPASTRLDRGRRRSMESSRADGRAADAVRSDAVPGKSAELRRAKPHVRSGSHDGRYGNDRDEADDGKWRRGFFR